MDGLQEDAASFEGPDYRQALVGTPFEGVKRFRTFGDCGPMYEVLAVEGDLLRVWLYNSGEETTIRRVDALEDPQAQ